MSNVLIVGATRGLGASLVDQYVSKGHHVFATSRSSTPPSSSSSTTWIGGIDLTSPSAGATLASSLKNTALVTVVITAGYFGKESFEAPDFEKELRMYTTSAVAPVLLVTELWKAGALGEVSKVVLVSSESGSTTLRHESEGGGNYAHHASKAALNMVGKLLSLDLKDKGVGVLIVHPGFMRTEMTKSVGFDQFWDQGGAVTPDVAATSLIEFIDTFDISKNGQFWAPRGPGDIGTAEAVLGKNLPTPLQLLW